VSSASTVNSRATEAIASGGGGDGGDGGGLSGGGGDGGDGGDGGGDGDADGGGDGEVDGGGDGEADGGGGGDGGDDGGGDGGDDGGGVGGGLGGGDGGGLGGGVDGALHVADTMALTSPLVVSIAVYLKESCRVTPSSAVCENATHCPTSGAAAPDHQDGLVYVCVASTPSSLQLMHIESWQRCIVWRWSVAPQSMSIR